MSFYGTIGDINLVNLDYPSIQPTLDLNFAKTKTLDPRIIFYRNSLATYTDDKGIVRTVPENVPRFDHDPTTGESLGLLIEEQRTNLLTYSTNFNDSSWTKFSSDRILANQIVASDGTVTGSKLIETLSGGAVQHSTYVIRSGTAQTLTFSVFVKAAERSKVYLQHSNFETAAAAATFDLTDGTVVTSATNADYTYISAYSIPYGNGWYRCVLTATKSTSTTYNVPLISIHNGTTPTYIGDGTSGIYIWGAQLEVGAFPTSYIPTSGSTVTRAADIPYIEGTNFSSFYDSTGGTILVESYLYNYSNGVISFGTSNYTQALGIFASGSPPGQFYIAGNYNTANAYTGGNTYLANQRNKICVGISSTGLKVCANGGSVNSSSGGTPIFTNFDRVGFGGNVAWDKTYTLQKVTHMASLKYYRTVLSDLQIKNLTS